MPQVQPAKIDYTEPEHWHEAACLFPLVSEEALAELTEDIKTNGLINPLTLHAGKLLDGRNRALACKRAGVPVRTVNLESSLSPTIWVLSQNQHRRHLTQSQLAVVALEAEKILSKVKDRGDRSAKLAAKAIGAGHSYVVQAKRIGVKNPALLEDIKAGKITIPEANKKLGFKQSTKAMVSSESNDWYTPKNYVEAVRKVLGEIELDPASCAVANKVVKAKKYYNEDDDGLKQKWSGKVFLNPPYGDVGPKFVGRLIEEYKAGNVKEAVLLLNSHVTDSKWFQPLFNYVLCFTDHRSKFWNDASPDGSASSPTHGSVFVYFGTNPAKFARTFAAFGAVVQRYVP